MFKSLKAFIRVYLCSSVEKAFVYSKSAWGRLQSAGSFTFTKKSRLNIQPAFF